MSNETHQKYPRSVQHGKPRLTSLKDGWLRVPIGNLVVEVSRPVDMRDDEIYTLVTAKRSRGGIVKREVLNGKDIAVKNQFYVREDDFLISKRQIVHGACGFVPKELDGAIVSNEYLVLNFTDKIIPQFWELLSHTVYFQQVCFHSSIGVHVEKMLFKVSTWHRWEVNIPSRKEQEKIASFLGAIDKRLTELRRKHELLQTYKRGVMQKIFSQEVRFKGEIGSAFPDWEKKKMGEVFTRITRKNKENNLNVLTISAQYGLINQREFFNKSVAADDLTGYYLLKCGDFAYNKSYSNGYPMGAIKRLNLHEKGVVSTLYICFSTSDEVEARFYEKYFDGGFLNHELHKIAQEGARNHGLLNMSVVEFFRDITLDNPDTEEQEKIADFLTAIDQKIEAVARQVDRTEQFKKGLLQKMFV